MGVGRIVAVDPEDFASENVHRHVLGVSHLGHKKADALCAELASRFPHLTFQSKPCEVERVLKEEPQLLREADLIVVAVGNETLEVRLNRLLHGVVPRVHTWLEPLGIAGHALAIGVRSDGAGCFECLLGVEPNVGLFNRANLTAPGHEVARSLAGCAGTFSPFSGLDAERTATEAGDLVGKVLLGSCTPNLLVTWRGTDTDFERSGLPLSHRATTIAAGERKRVSGDEFSQDDCPVCARHTGNRSTYAAEV
jgi:hypothetical protein